MQKFAPIIFLLIGLALPDKAEAEDVIGGRPIIYVSHLTIEEQGDLQEPMLGLGIGMPFFFRNYRFCIEPELRLEVTVPFPFSALEDFGPMLLRSQTGINFGILMPPFSPFFLAIISWGFYAGLSGIFMQDFTNDVALAGISPQIGLTISANFLAFIRIQEQYEWFTDPRYNRFVFTCLIGLWLADYDMPDF